MKLARTLAALILSAAAAMAQAQTHPPYGAPIGQEAAKKAVAAAIAEAKKNGWNVSVAVVDTGGHLVAFERIDSTQVASGDIAIGKARTANNFRRPTKALEDAVAGGRTVLLAVPGIMPLEGGLLIVMDGKIAGAVGVSGVTSRQDAVAAKAGVDALAKPAE